MVGMPVRIAPIPSTWAWKLVLVRCVNTHQTVKFWPCMMDANESVSGQMATPAHQTKHMKCPPGPPGTLRTTCTHILREACRHRRPGVQHVAQHNQERIEREVPPWEKARMRTIRLSYGKYISSDPVGARAAVVPSSMLAGLPITRSGLEYARASVIVIYGEVDVAVVRVPQT